MAAPLGPRIRLELSGARSALFNSVITICTKGNTTSEAFLRHVHAVRHICDCCLLGPVGCSERINIAYLLAAYSHAFPLWHGSVHGSDSSDLVDTGVWCRVIRRPDCYGDDLFCQSNSVPNAWVFGGEHRL